MQDKILRAYDVAIIAMFFIVAKTVVLPYFHPFLLDFFGVTTK